MRCIVKADCDNEFCDPQPSYALLDITPRLLDRVRSRMKSLESLREQDPFFLKAHFCEEAAVVAWLDLWNDDQHDDLYLEIDGHNFDKEPVMVVPDDFDLPAEARIVCDMDTMLVYTDEFSFRSVLRNRANVVYVVPMFDPDNLHRLLDGALARKAA